MVNSCTPGTPTAEICGDGKDNDCNGTVDNGCVTANVDLYVSSVTAPISASQGGTITVGATINKSGSGSASASTARIYLYGHLKGKKNRYVKLGKVAVPAFSTGPQNYSFSTSVKIPKWLASGSHKIIVKADFNDVVAEWNESNNMGGIAIKIVP